MTETLSAAAARRIALAAQGFAALRPVGPVDWGHVRRTLARTQLLQIDSVNVVSRAHYLPLFSRLGAYPRELVERAAWGPKPRRLFEYWAHEASLLPVELQPLLRWRMARAREGRGGYVGLRRFGREQRPLIDGVLARIAAEGALTAADLEGRGAGGWWGWSEGKRALEWLFLAGFVTTATRRGGFERVYDMAERVLPRAVLDAPTPDEPEAHRALLLRAAQAHGVGTAADLADYFRLTPTEALTRLAELVEAGDLTRVQVRGWERPAYLHPAARRPRRVEAQALLAPFDPLIWRRERTERLFGVRYRIEIYTPVEKRTHGYYVLPFLLGEGLAARVDLKADRAAGVLRVQAAHLEPEAPKGETAEALAGELRTMAGWLGLEAVAVAGRGDLAADLAQALASATGGGRGRAEPRRRSGVGERAPHRAALSKEALVAVFNKDILKLTEANTNWQKEVYYDEQVQIVMMSIPPGEDIGEEVHDADQSTFIVSGEGQAKVGDSTTKVSANHLVVVPKGSKHNFINKGDTDLKIYTIYAPPAEEKGISHKTKEEAEAAEED